MRFPDDGEVNDPANLETDRNPLNPAGDSLEKLIQIRVNEDLWTAMRGELPCLDMTETCVQQLQALAVQNNPVIKQVQLRIEAINAKIEAAKKANQQSVRLAVFEPLLQSWLRVETVVEEGKPRKKGLLQRIGGLFFGDTVNTVNEILSLVGLPLFRNANGGTEAAQNRSIAIADLQVKVAQIEKEKSELIIRTREQVVLNVLDFDQFRREFQITQEIARRSTTRMKVIELDYRFASGTMTTPGFLNEISAVDRQKAETFRSWAKVRSQLTRVKLLIVPSDAL